MKNARKALTHVFTLMVALLTGGMAQADPSSSAPGFTAPSTSATSSGNTASGANALSSNTTGTFNTAGGSFALEKNTEGSYNTAHGCYALEGNTTGSDNTATGYTTLNANTIGYSNTATGGYALSANTTGYSNTADGRAALYSNTTGTFNTATGGYALESNTTGSRNTAAGFNALYNDTTGSRNTAVGNQALNHSSTGEYNIGLGTEAGLNVTTGSNNIEIGNQGVTGDAEVIRLGAQGTQTKAFVAGIFGTTVTGGAPVYVTSTGQLGTLSSSAKFKRNIHDMGRASDALLALRPVTFQYQSAIDPTGTPQFGLVAEEVEKVSPDLVVHDADRQIYTVRYEAVNAMLLNEFQKQHETIVEQQKFVDDQMKINAEQQKLIQSLAARLEQLEQTQAKSR
jgi:hypothetical protein